MNKIMNKMLAKVDNNSYNNVTLERGAESVRLAICDDESSFRNKLNSAISTFDGLPDDVHIEEFSDGLSLVENHEKCPFGIIFLDIEMDGMSGMETGQKIRNSDRNVIIILVTNYRSYMQQSFKIEIFDYVTKPYTDEDIHAVLRRALQKYRDQHYKIVLTWNGNTYALDVGDIVYVETEKRYLNFVTMENVYKCYGKLNNYEKELSPYGFFRCHKSFLINMDYIKSIEDKTIVTEQHKDILISTRKRKKCLEAFADFVAKYRI